MAMVSDHNSTNRPPLGIVVAMSRDGVIGDRGGLPWDLPDDRKLFRKLTEGNTVIMGRLTFESLPAPLANRHNIVVSRSLFQLEGATVCRRFLGGVAHGWRLGRPIFVIGGVELYRKALPIADTLHISWVEGNHKGDRRFPALDLAAWDVVEAVDYPGFQYVVYRRPESSSCLKGQSLISSP